MDGIAVNQLRQNGSLVELLGGELRNEAHILRNAPALLKRILVEDAWRSFETKRGEQVQHESFAAFVTTPPLRGLGVSVDLVERLLSDDVHALDLLAQAKAGKRGAPKGNRNAAKVKLVPVEDEETKGDNITVCSDDRGTGRTYALRRLKAEAPSLHAQVLAGELSPHRAMVQAGLRRVPTALEALQRTWAKATAEERRAFLSWVGERMT